MMTTTQSVCLLFLMLGVSLMASCAHYPQSRMQKASDVAHKAGFTPETFRTDYFNIFGFSRFSDTADKTLRIYIEGDGMAWRTKTRPAKDPTPREPLVLSLASQDSAPNVLYLARPCHYIQSTQCSRKYWTSHRASREVVESYSAILETLRHDHGFESFHLVGYSGGATIALVLAGVEDGILSVRSVAGNLSPNYHSQIHGVDPQYGSLEPLGFMKSLARLPQIHYFGAEDKIVPPAIGTFYTAQFKREEGASECIRIQVVPEISHNKGWLEFWPRASEQIPECD